MSDLFKIIKSKDCDISMSISLGITIRLGDIETTCPISKQVSSLAGFDIQIQDIKKNLDLLMEKAKRVFQGEPSPQDFELSPDMASEKIWEILSSISNTNIMIDRFNALDEEKRKEVADYILTQTNVFSGVGAIFSSRYDNDSALLE